MKRPDQRPEVPSDEPATVIANPRVLYGLDDEAELTPVVEANTASSASAKAQNLGMRMVLVSLLLVAVGLFAYRGLSARLKFSRVAAEASQAASKRSLEQKAAAQARPAPQIEEEKELVLPSTPEKAARAFARGEYEEALAQYRYLAQEKPDAEVYRVMVKVLSTRRREH